MIYNYDSVLLFKEMIFSLIGFIVELFFFFNFLFSDWDPMQLLLLMLSIFLIVFWTVLLEATMVTSTKDSMKLLEELPSTELILLRDTKNISDQDLTWSSWRTETKFLQNYNFIILNQTLFIFKTKIKRLFTEY